MNSLSLKSSFLLMLVLLLAMYAQAQKQVANNIQYTIQNNERGIEVRPFEFSPATLVRNDKWSGKWIWLNDKINPSNRSAKSAWSSHEAAPDAQYRSLFRKEIDIDKIPAGCFMFISADVAYRLYINDSLVSQGPVNVSSDYGDDTAPKYWFYSSLDIQKYLRRGKNLVAVEVFSWAFEISQATQQRGRFIADIKEQSGKVLASTDETWKSMIDTSYRYPKGLLTINSNKEPVRWNRRLYDDVSWSSSSIVDANAQNPLYVSEIPVPVKRLLKPIHISVEGRIYSSLQAIEKVSNGEQCIFDYGRNMAAFLRFSIRAAAGDSIEVQPLEKLENSPNRSFVFICRDGINDYETPYLSAYRYLRVIIHSRAPVTIKSFSALYSSYPVTYQGSFECSDPFYSRLWEIVRWTTQLCMNDMFFDSPMHQEPIACTGDYFIQSMNNYYAFGDPWLTRQNLIQTARMLQKNDYRMFHTSYSLIWVQMLRQYFQFTGDTALVKQLMPDVRNLLQRFHSYLDKDYLVSNAPDYMFMDWISIKGFNAHHPPAVIGMGYMTTLYAKALVELSVMNSVVKVEDDRVNILYDSIRVGVNQRLWDGSQGLYRDGYAFLTSVKPGPWLPADTNIVTYSAHMNSLAVLYGIAPANKRAALMNYVITQDQYELQPYFMWYVLNSLQSIHAIDDGLEVINRWKNGIDTVTYTLKENWRDKTEFGYGGDYSHAWGGAALYFLSQNVLGISPGVAGYKRIDIRPYVGSKLSWAKGDVPLNNNETVNVQWKRLPDGTVECRYKVPQGHTATFYVPDAWKGYSVFLKGKAQKNQATFECRPGTTTFVFKVSPLKK